MTRAQAHLLVNRYWGEVERESLKLLQHPFLSHRDWSNSAKVNEFVEVLSGYVQFAHARFEQATGLCKLTLNEEDIWTTFKQYLGAGPGFVSIQTWSLLLSYAREGRSPAELNEITDNIVVFLNDVGKFRKFLNDVEEFDDPKSSPAADERPST